MCIMDIQGKVCGSNPVCWRFGLDDIFLSQPILRVRKNLETVGLTVIRN